MAISSDPVPYWEMWPLRSSSITETPSRSVAELLWKRAGLSPSDIQVAQLYDCYSYTLLSQIEDYGFCDKGDAADFVSDGSLRLGGALPVNTHGGHLGEAYIHGFNHVVEAVRQIRGTSYSQVKNVEHVLVTGGTPSATSAMVLGKEPR
jgi:acetyl-CoA acetyltransferase